MSSDPLWLKALNSASSDIDFAMNKNPKCPHCGNDFDVFEREAFYLFNEDTSHDVECDVCDLPFTIRSVSSWHFDTSEQDDAA